MQWTFKHYTFQNEDNKLFKMSLRFKYTCLHNTQIWIMKQSNDTKYLLSEGSWKKKTDTFSSSWIIAYCLAKEWKRCQL